MRTIALYNRQGQRLLTLKEAEKLIRTNRIQDGKTIAGILWTLHFGR